MLYLFLIVFILIPAMASAALFFLRDPERKAPAGDLILCPADGTVVEIKEKEDLIRKEGEMQRKLNNLLLSYKYMDEDYAPLILKRYKGLKWDIVVDMMVMKAFKTFNYFSYFGCLKLFFQHSTFIDALLFSSVFSTLFLIPPVILTSLYKGLLIIRYGKGWKAKWNFINSAIRSVFDGTRRRNEQPH